LQHQSTIGGPEALLLTAAELYLGHEEVHLVLVAYGRQVPAVALAGGASVVPRGYGIGIDTPAQAVVLRVA
jgi:hypothetical protein